MARGRQAKKDTSKPRRVSSRSHADPDVIVAIQDTKRIGGVDHYLVKWSQSTKKDSWEPASDVKKVAKSLIDEFLEGQAADQEYEVEGLVDRKRIGNEVKYLVKWKGFGSDDNTWEDGSGIPGNLIKEFEKQYGKLAPKREKSATATEADEGAVTPKKRSKGVSKSPAPKKTSDISTIFNRKIINNVLHYEVKFVGNNGKKELPIFEIEDLDAIVSWEREHFAEGVTHIDEEQEYAVEKILDKRGVGKNTKYRVKWMGYKSSENTWEKAENLTGAKKMIDEYEKKEDERMARMAEKDFELERIVDEKFHRGETWYFIKWKNYKSLSNTWEPEENIKDTAADLIAKWQAVKVKKAERREIAMKKAAERKEATRTKREAEKAKKKAEKEAAKAAKDAEKTTETPAAEPTAEETPAE